MSIPQKYAWLGTIGTLPRTIAVALTLLGTKEVVGRGSNKTIMQWRDELNAAAGVDPLAQKVVGYSDDDIAWCGLFAAIVAFRAGKAVVKDPLWARHWAKFGTGVAAPGLGDVLVFEREGGGGHVGFYVGEDARFYHVLGGNQSNAVTITRIEKGRCIAKRRPIYNQAPATVRQFKITGDGGAISTNEA